jgi:uncharacterized protein (DUF433 family)
VITLLREASFSLQQIKQDEIWFANFFGVSKPFAYADFWGAFPDILTRHREQLLSGSRGGQYAMAFLEEFATPVARRLRFSNTSKRAESWWPADGVQLRPDVQLGQPCVGESRVPTSAIWGYLNAGDGRAFIAQSFGLEVADIDAAFEWETRIRADGALAPAA